MEKFDRFDWTNFRRYAYDVIGRLLYGHDFGFLEQKMDVNGYIDSIERSLPLLVFAAVGPTYLRTPILIAGIFIPGILPALKALDKLKAQACALVERRKKAFLENGQKESDIMNQLFRIIQERGSEVDFNDKEVIVESWVGL